VLQVATLLDISPDDVLRCSGRTGDGVEALLNAVIERVPPPKSASEDFSSEKVLGSPGRPQVAPSRDGGQARPDYFLQKNPQGPRALIFDFQYSDHQGVIVYVRMFEGAVKKGDTLEFAATGRKFNALEVGSFAPTPTPLAEGLSSGSIGYIVTGIKEPGLARVGDTVRSNLSKTPPLPGYEEPRPVVWASIYPESQDDFVSLRQALSRLRLSDSSLSYEEEASGSLGRGYRCGFLGMLHLEIVTERLRREFNLTLVVTTPTITYEVETRDHKRKTVYSPSQFPDFGQIEHVWEPMVAVEVVLPASYVGALMPLLYDHEAVVDTTENFSEDRVIIKVTMPLRELMRNFFDKLKERLPGLRLCLLRAQGSCASPMSPGSTCLSPRSWCRPSRAL
jgi:GTP-binding protein LepA